MTNAQLHGVLSLGATMIAAGIAAVAMGQTSWALAVGYGVVYVVGWGLIVGAFCAKCPCKAHCGHVLPGKLTAWFPRRPSAPYQPWEWTLLIVALAGWVILPQPWLVGQLGLFAVYWVLMAAAGVQILLFVCRACRNVYCPIREMQTRHSSGQ